MRRGANAAQWLRKALQLGVVAMLVWTAFGGAFRNYKLAHNHRRLVALMEGETWGFLYGLKEDLLSLWGEPYQASLNWLGFPWAARVFGLDTVDPLLAASLAARSGEVPAKVWLALLVPLLVALLFGKVFCSHLCPMRLLFELGQQVRAGLQRLGVYLPRLRLQSRLGGWVLLGGLLAALASSTAIWLVLLPYVSLSAGLFIGIAAGLLSPLLIVVLWWFVFDLALAPGLFCHNLCPTGFLLELFGRRSWLRLRKLGKAPCPTGCNACVRSCPFELEPKHETHTPACNNCGQCVVACPSERLVRRGRLPVLAAGLPLVLALSSPASAHHNKGLPHYGYFENYPQVPTEEYVTLDGNWEIGATIFNFQGYDRRGSNTPNDVKIYLYLYDLKRDQGHTGPVDFEIHYEGQRISRFERVQVDEEAVYSTRETLPRSGDYDIVAFVGSERVVLPFHVEIHSDAVSPWTVAGVTLPVLTVFCLAWVGRARRRRRRRRSPATRAALVTSLLATLLPASPGLTQPGGVAVEQQALCPHCGMPACSMDHEAMGEQAVARSKPVSSGDSLGEVCPHCGMLNCPMDHATFGRNSTDHMDHAATDHSAHANMVHFKDADGHEVMLMGGMPLWLFLLAIGCVIALSFVATERFAPVPSEGRRLNLIKRRRTYRLLRNRRFQTLPQLAMVVMLAFLVYVGLFGSRFANLTPVAVWTLWWAGLVFTVLVLGSAWCFVCPWDGLANLISRLGAGKRVESLSLKLPFPKSLANMYPAIALFFVLTWLELGYGVTTNPRTTAFMGLGMAACAVMAALLWDGKKFCAHLCPVGRICGIYSNFSPVEIRARNPRACQVCTTEDCLHGNAQGHACPTGLSLKTLKNATMCTACTECFKSCHKHNVALNLRPFGADLRKPQTIRLDEAWLAVMLLSLTLFHGLSMTPAWENFEPGGTSLLKWMSLELGLPKDLSFTLAMLLVVSIPVGMYWLSCVASAAFAGGSVPARTLFVQYAHSLLPVALFYHLAHNLMHLLMEGGEVVPLLSDPMGQGADLFGTRGIHVGSLIGEHALWYMQVGLILVGHVYGIVVAHRVGHRLFSDKKAARRSLAVMPLMMIAISVCGLWLMHLDMNMRVGRM
ncbi:MAG: 4Fe-4S binding protein [Proteobacteria bacterium]|nr:4Fe-4S binding protein [Pseudomonadota bacterium]